MKTKDNSKAKIVETALALFSREGYDKTPISRIAKEAGISQGLMYNYFSSKDQLLDEIIKTNLAFLEKALESFMEERSASDSLQEYILANFGEAERNKEFWRLYYGLRVQNPDPGKKDDIEKEKDTNDIVLSKLEESFRKLGAKDPASEAAILAAMVDGVIMHYLLQEKTYKLETIKNNLVKKYTF